MEQLRLGDGKQLVDRERRRRAEANCLVWKSGQTSFAVRSSDKPSSALAGCRSGTPWQVQKHAETMIHYFF